MCTPRGDENTPRLTFQTEIGSQNCVNVKKWYFYHGLGPSPQPILNPRLYSYMVTARTFDQRDYLMQAFFLKETSTKKIKCVQQWLSIQCFHPMLPHSAPTWILNPSRALLRARVGSKITFDQPTHRLHNQPTHPPHRFRNWPTHPADMRKDPDVQTLSEEIFEDWGNFLSFFHVFHPLLNH